ncbi:hypothetical protein HPP92_023701 [Vanilla planifolia]|uniref:Uncharacterized protein n=1 Tax=Vanilla planifolia TaxID=51239 RepID=A0A835UD38_VANPL|nr:hypothetical protein HPP92_023701 [Vanilla planifolia]
MQQDTLFSIDPYSSPLWTGNWSQLCPTCKIIRPVRSSTAQFVNIVWSSLTIIALGFPTVLGRKTSGTSSFSFAWGTLTALLGAGITVYRIFLRLLLSNRDIYRITDSSIFWKVDASYDDRTSWSNCFSRYGCHLTNRALVLTITQASQIAGNITTNEVANALREKRKSKQMLLPPDPKKDGVSMDDRTGSSHQKDLRLGEATGVQATLRLENPGFATDYLCIGRKSTMEDIWEKLEGSFTLTSLPKRLVFYLEGPPPGVNLLINSVAIFPTSPCDSGGAYAPTSRKLFANKFPEIVAKNIFHTDTIYHPSISRRHLAYRNGTSKHIKIEEEKEEKYRE